ncbi:MAG TPA: T9SS type A sorting domain-containing protein [Thermoplasmata archaeon]|nr:T9SS type A sorting domain-containing protein [Thermoplasmata archaeon]
MPTNFALFEAKPNPTKGVTEISFSIPTTTDVELTIYDVSGRLVATLVKGRLNAGTHTATWNGLDSHGRRVAQGVYFYRLRADEFNATKKLLLIR